jgi:hypothetical protein
MSGPLKAERHQFGSANVVKVLMKSDKARRASHRDQRASLFALCERFLKTMWKAGSKRNQAGQERRSESCSGPTLDLPDSAGGGATEDAGKTAAA